MKQEATGQFARLIRSEAEYDEVVREIQRLLDENPKEGSPGDERIEFLSLLVEDYDRKHYELPGPDPTPQDIVEFMLDAQGADRAVLAEVMGGRSRVSEFFAGKRPLSISQVYALRDLLKIPADLLLGETPASASQATRPPASRGAPRVVRPLSSRVRETPTPHKSYGGNVGVHADRESSIKRAAVHVVPSSKAPGKFVVEVRGKALTEPTTKSAAIARGKSLARANKSSLAIHSPSGQITTKRISKDPSPPKDRHRN